MLLTPVALSTGPLEIQDKRQPRDLHISTRAGRPTLEKGRCTFWRWGPLTMDSTLTSGEKGRSFSSLGVRRKHCGVPGRPAAMLSRLNTCRWHLELD